MNVIKKNKELPKYKAKIIMNELKQDFISIIDEHSHKDDFSVVDLRIKLNCLINESLSKMTAKEIVHPFVDNYAYGMQLSTLIAQTGTRINRLV
jgi:hypothetical protein